MEAEKTRRVVEESPDLLSCTEDRQDRRGSQDWSQWSPAKQETSHNTNTFKSSLGKHWSS